MSVDASTLHMARRIGIAMPRIRVVRAYLAQYANPIQFPAGAIVSLGEPDTEWPAFAWTTTADGNAGWAPVDWLKALGDGRAQALRDYSAKEVTADVGEEGHAAHGYGGWTWIFTDRGASGWIPDTHLEILSEPEMSVPTVEALAIGWIAYWSHGAHENPEASEPYAWADFDTYWLNENDPEKLWAVILEIYGRPEAKAHFGILAAGPLEDLLGRHGPSFIERIETLAKQDHEFAHLLGGVWQFTMSDEIWARVQAVWNRKGWDGIPE